MKKIKVVVSIALLIFVPGTIVQAQNTRTPRAPYTNPANYDTAATTKGIEYLECKINGTPFGIYSYSNAPLPVKTSPTTEAQSYIMKDVAQKKEVYITFTNPALWPDIRNFEFGKPTFKTTKAERYCTQENTDLYFAFGLVMQEPALGMPCRAATHIGREVGGDNITAGSFEILYFEPVKGGLVEAKFTLTLKSEQTRDGKPQPDVVISNGRMRFRMRN